MTKQPKRKSDFDRKDALYVSRFVGVWGLLGAGVALGIVWFALLLVLQFSNENDRNFIVYFMAIANCILASAMLGYMIYSQNQSTDAMENLMYVLERLEGLLEEQNKLLVQDKIKEKTVLEDWAGKKRIIQLEGRYRGSLWLVLKGKTRNRR